MTKKILLLALLSCTIFGCSEEKALRPDNEHLLFVITDTHYLDSSLMNGPLFDEMVLKHADGRLTQYCNELMDAFIDTCLREKPDAVLVTGDISFNGEYYSHESFAKQLEKLKKAGIQPLVIPGNHDIESPGAYNYSTDPLTYTKATSKDDFRNIYINCGYQDAYLEDENSLSYVYVLNDKCWLLMLDTCKYEENTVYSASAGGRIRPEQMEWIEEVLKEASSKGAQVITATHHTMASMVDSDNYQIDNFRSLTDLLTTYDVPINLCGHTHVQYYKPVERDAGTIMDIMTSSYMINPHQYGILQWIEENHIQYDTERVDVESWAKKNRIKDPFFTDFKTNAEVFFKEASTSRLYSRVDYDFLDEKTKKALLELKGEENLYTFAGRMPEFIDYYNQSGLDSVIQSLPEEAQSLIGGNMKRFKYDGNHVTIDLKK
ncbi:MAG: metallophosphoesterase [Solobacterium sp.]|nr:metallophosphoesterase [Solobacterium sp.]